ncbi:MAG: hypothetical protein IJ527_01365 [Prevotella sp.]|nr:hypothetical protein [Prevotella sp.]
MKRTNKIRSLLLCATAIALQLSLFTSCNELTPEEQASLAAKGYYEHLAAGEYDQYMEGVSGTKEAPADYTEQLRASAKQYVGRLKQQHQGIEAVEVRSARSDTTLHCTEVFLLLRFTDTATEEICVPMVEQDGRWLLK